MKMVCCMQVKQGQQLTWMDARIGTWVVTPRMGKPVEIQALWYNALKIFAELLQLNKQKKDADLVECKCRKSKTKFRRNISGMRKEIIYMM